MSLTGPPCNNFPNTSIDPEVLKMPPECLVTLQKGRRIYTGDTEEADKADKEKQMDIEDRPQLPPRFQPAREFYPVIPRPWCA